MFLYNPWIFSWHSWYFFLVTAGNRNEFLKLCFICLSMFFQIYILGSCFQSWSGGVKIFSTVFGCEVLHILLVPICSFTSCNSLILYYPPCGHICAYFLLSARYHTWELEFRSAWYLYYISSSSNWLIWSCSVIDHSGIHLYMKMKMKRNAIEDKIITR